MTLQPRSLGILRGLSASLAATTFSCLPSIALPASSSTAIDSYDFTRLQFMQLELYDLPGLGEPTQYLPESKPIHLVLRLEERRVYVYRGEEILASYPVAIGRDDTPTPLGEFTVFQMIENPVWQSPWTGEIRTPGANSALGLRWIGFVRLSNGIVGFHGTPTVSSIGQAASNGCVRMRNEDVLELFEQVQLGTPVLVEP
jgi:hypothetical protein